MAISIVDIEDDQVRKITAREEGHFLDFKAIEIAPAKLTKAMSGFANADGGELYIGFDETTNGDLKWRGFTKMEDSNGHIQALEKLFPLGASFRYTFLRNSKQLGLILYVEAEKTPDIRIASDNIAYLRRGAQNLPQTSDEQKRQLELSKGVVSFEDNRLNCEVTTISNSLAALGFILDVVPTVEPEQWLRKQRLIANDKPTVAGAMLFSDEPQTDIPKSAIKIYRYKTANEPTRETLAFDPISVEGNAYSQIFGAVEKVREITSAIPLLGEAGLEKVEYPPEAIHEIITNAVIHRDYSVNDDVHVRIFDNRIEVQSPGRLPAHITQKNILEERFARNPKIVRILNKHKNPPNKDVGEGLNTAFEVMRKLKLRDPTVAQVENGVLVVLRHEKLGTPEEIIVEYLRDHDEINNAIARAKCFIGSENTVKRIFQKMMEAKIIERIPNRPLNKTGYSKGRNFPQG